MFKRPSSAMQQLARVRSLEINVIVAQAFGVPIFLRENSSCKRTLIATYGVISLVLFNFFYFYFEIMDVVMNSNDFNKIVQNLAVSITHLGGTLKFFNILIRLRDVNRLVQKARELPSTYFVKGKHDEILKASELENKFIVTAYSSTVIFTSFTACYNVITNPLVMGNKFPFRLHFPDMLSTEYRLSYCCLGVIMLGIQIVAVDSINFLLVNQVRCHLKFLIANLKDLASNQSDQIDSCQILKECIKYHQEILKLRNDIEDIFNAPILVQFLISLFVVVLTGFEAIVLSAEDGVLLIYLYSSGVMFQLFAYCWFTNQVMEQNKLLVYAGYDTSWFEFGNRYSKMLLLFMINAQKPLTFTAGGFFSLSLNTFTAMLSRSYSCIAVLRQLYAE